MIKFKLKIFYLLLLISYQLFAQQDSQYTQYMYNTVNINPAYAGSRDALSIFLLHRTQWVGLDGAPVTKNASLHTPIADSDFGIGLSFVNDRIGPTTENLISVDLAYFIQITSNYKLSVGLKGTAAIFNLDVNKLNVFDQNDPKFQNLNADFNPNIGAGLYLFSDATYVGLSVPNFFESKHYNDNDVAITREKMHFYLIAGHVFELSPSIKFKPAFLTKIVEGAPFQLDVTANFLINEKFTIGGAYRWDSAVSSLVGFQISESMFIGYGYDMETTKLSNYNSGSHEVFFRFELFNKNRVTSPRFF
jgi:type IX secretion system PorP/SprF family membrane protein